MKNLFTRYVPVEGDIKRGDKVLYKGVLYDFSDLFVEDKSSVITDGGKKVKLFLCSRNIQVGDTGIYMWTKKHGGLISNIENATFDKLLPNGRAHLTYPTGEASTTYPFESNPYEEDLHGFTGDTYKVIGEVSPQATWITEGMEFDEEEISIIYGIIVKKTYRNGECSTTLSFSTLPSDEDIQEQAEYWGEHIDSSGWNYGYRLYWENKPFISEVKFKCSNCKHFH